MSLLTINLVDFRNQFSAYAGLSDSTILMYWDMATDYISAENYGLLSDGSRQLALYLLTAHLLHIANKIGAGTAAGVIQNATEGSVSVGLMQPPIKTAFDFWLNQSPYGQQLLALLTVKSAFGLYVGGSSAQGNIRKHNGAFY